MLLDEKGKFSSAIKWISSAGDPSIVSHPVVDVNIELLWAGVVRRQFIVSRLWNIVNLWPGGTLTSTTRDPCLLVAAQGLPTFSQSIRVWRTNCEKLAALDLFENLADWQSFTLSSKAHFHPRPGQMLGVGLAALQSQFISVSSITTVGLELELRRRLCPTPSLTMGVPPSSTA